MTIVEDVWTTPADLERVVLTLGSFDGVHLGHRRILEQVIQEAHSSHGVPAVLTFRPHPREFFSPSHAPNLLTTDTKKLALFEAAGVEVVFLLEFTESLAKLPARDFAQTILRERCRATSVVVGHDFRFGRNAEGDYHLLAAIATELGFTVTQVTPLLIQGERVSSTLIREHLLEGDLDKVEQYLGRRYSITGRVVAGRGLGAGLGFPTANVKPHHSAVPPQGVYAAETLVGGVRRPAAVNIGIAPTIRHEDITIEVYLLNFSGDLMGQEIEVFFLERLRPERKFPSRDALVEQIAHDVAEVARRFAETR